MVGKGWFKRVVIGAMNKKAGCAGSIYNLLEDDRFNHRAEVVRGVMEKECSEMMSEFFKNLRYKCQKYKNPSGACFGKDLLSFDTQKYE